MTAAVALVVPPEIERFGASALRSRTSLMPIRSILADGMAEIASGVRCRFSPRFWAVTMISSRPLLSAATVCAIAADAARLVPASNTTARARLNVFIVSNPPKKPPPGFYDPYSAFPTSPLALVQSKNASRASQKCAYFMIAPRASAFCEAGSAKIAWLHQSHSYPADTAHRQRSGDTRPRCTCRALRFDMTVDAHLKFLGTGAWIVKLLVPDA